jgi:hypothetical protein
MGWIGLLWLVGRLSGRNPVWALYLDWTWWCTPTFRGRGRKIWIWCQCRAKLAQDPVRLKNKLKAKGLGHGLSGRNSCLASKRGAEKKS